MARQYVIHAKVGTHGSTALRLWFDKDCNVKKGEKILAMPESLYQSLHSSWRIIKANGSWNWYIVHDLEPIVFVTEISTFKSKKQLGR